MTLWSWEHGGVGLVVGFAAGDEGWCRDLAGGAGGGMLVRSGSRRIRS